MESEFSADRLFYEQRIPVLSVTNARFNERAAVENITLVATGSLVQVDQDKDVLNDGAGPCLIAWGFNHRAGQVLSGHFPLTGHDQFTAFAREVTMDQHSSGVELFRTQASKEEAMAHLRYQQMFDVLEDWVRRDGHDAVEIYLFGQNVFELLSQQDEMEQVLLHYDVIRSLTERGLSTAKIYDYRVRGVAKSDHTLYVGSERSLWHDVDYPRIG